MLWDMTHVGQVQCGDLADLVIPTELEKKKHVRERDTVTVQALLVQSVCLKLSETAVATWFLLVSMSFPFPFYHSFGRPLHYHTGITIIIVIINPFFYTDNKWNTV